MSINYQRSLCALVLSCIAAPVFACAVLSPDDCLAIGRQKSKTPSPLRRALQQGKVEQLPSLLDLTDVHGSNNSDELGQPVCVYLAKTRVPRQVSALSLLLQHGDHTGCCDFGGKSVSDCASAKQALEKIKIAIKEALQSSSADVPPALVVIITSYMTHVKPAKRMMCPRNSSDSGA